MKKIYLLLLIFFVLSCKSTPKIKTADDPGLSQLDLTAEDDNEADAEFSDETSADEMSADEMSANESSSDASSANESSSDKNTLAQDGTTDVSEISENPETKTDDLQPGAQIEGKQSIADAVNEVKETPKSEDKKPSAPAVQPQPVVTKGEPSPAPAAPPEQPAEEKQDAAQSEDDAPQTPPPRRQPWITPPPVVSAVRDDAPVPNRQELIPPREDNVFSRIVNATVGQYVEIPFRGTNWSYLEDIVSRRGIAYDSRRNDSEGMVFTFRAEEAGTYVLRFYRRDYIRDYILYDYVQVVVGESPNKSSGAGWINPPSDRGKVTAEPRWPSALDEAAMLRGGAKQASGPSAESAPSQASSANRDSSPAQTQAAPPQVSSANRESAPAQTQAAGIAPQTVTPPVTAAETQPAAKPPTAEKQEKLPPEEILKKAQDAFKEGNTAAAIALLDQYTEYYPGGSDELYWLYGQFYEANTPSRNILLSLDNYRRLVNEYPQSRHYSDARRRISYLERFYINIQ